MSGHVALVCLCVLSVLSASPNVLGQDGDHRPSAETGEQAWSRIIEKVGQARLDERGRGGQQANCGVIEPPTSYDPRTSVLQDVSYGKKEEPWQAFANQLTACNSRLDAAQEKLLTLLEIHHKEAESLRAEVLRLNHHLEESARALEIRSQHLDRLEKTKAQRDLEVTALTAKVQELSGDVARLRANEEELKEKLSNQTSDLQQEMFDQILNSTKSVILQESAKLGQDLVNVNSGINTILQSASDSNITLAIIKNDLIMKSDEILLQISASKTKVEEGFDKMAKEQNSKYTALEAALTQNASDSHTSLTKLVQDVKNEVIKKSDDLLKEISSTQTSVVERFINITKDQDSKCTELRNKQGSSQETDLQTTLTKLIQDAEKNITKKWDKLLVDITSVKIKVEEGFDKMTKERNSNFTALQTKNEATLKIIESTAKQVKFVASAAAAGLTLLGDKYYYFGNKTKMTWHAARDFCVSRGLTLATIESAGESQSVFDQKQKFGMGDTWFGGSDEAQEGTWRWTGTGATLTYTNWRSDQPDGGTESNCLEMRSDGKWHDFRCTAAQPFICEQQN